ncbi:STAS domain-containing protein [Mycobacterium ostraviense]|uniref:Sulfate transporter n=1 Tax=Mycobacterium ostraviense TaxID=2738409 RepID=A0A163WXR6_9MYCO|nr:STAS domain-containing protein [Mycobacterium ostraviense]KZS58792.1 sulfate transporter [Mycobacterium ostraviense]UGT90428.1 STAS domain-containing protein [Mycobacterium ostraviense]
MFDGWSPRLSVIQSWQKCGTADFTASYGPSAGVITVEGELDAANADQLAGYVQQCVRSCRWLILDLRRLEFIGTAGFSALHRINVVCSAADTQWAMVPSRAVSRLLEICDPDGALPVMEPVNPVNGAPDGDLRLLELVAEPR